jgi:hypothetical protein
MSTLWVFLRLYGRDKRRLRNDLVKVLIPTYFPFVGVRICTFVFSWHLESESITMGLVWVNLGW